MGTDETAETFLDDRLDVYVARKSPGISRSFVTKIIQDGFVSVDQKIVRKAGYKVKPTDIVQVNYDFEKNSDIPDMQIEIIYEDDDCVVINKPAGILSHSKGPYNPEPTVETWLHSRNPKLKGNRAGIVHRLDRLTSGVMICAKSADAKIWLQKQFSLRKVKKTYDAVVQGTLNHDHAIVDVPIERNPKKPQTFHAGVNGKKSLTEYNVLREAAGLSLLELRPLTGRTHQLRVHLKYIGHPIVGDTLYGGIQSDRLYLHALHLEITLPNRNRKVFTAKLPSDFNTIMGGREKK